MFLVTWGWFGMGSRLTLGKDPGLVSWDFRDQVVREVQCGLTTLHEQADTVVEDGSDLGDCALVSGRNWFVVCETNVVASGEDWCGGCCGHVGSK
jgi:hypothetical protein